MIFRILKNDLRHKKVTNLILLIFIALAAMFVSGSVNSILTISTAQKDYFDKAGLYDYFAVLRDEPDGDEFEKAAKSFEHSDGYIRERHLFVLAGGMEKRDGEDVGIDNNIIMLTAVENLGMKMYSDDNKELTAIPDGEMFIPQKTIDIGKLAIGDEIRVTVGENTLELTVGGIVKDAMFGSPFMSGYRFLISQKDYDMLADGADESAEKCSIMGFMSSDAKALMQEAATTNISSFGEASRSTMEMTCIMDIIVACTFLLVSVVLIVISFVVLSFTIKFTLDQEFREIGVMKAIGIADKKTEGLYLVKYIFLAAVGGVLGFFGGIPFGNMLIRSSAGNMLTVGRDPYTVNLACVLLVMLVVVLFCRRRVRILRKFTPVDAVRSGSSGETYSKKSRVSLSNTRLKPAGFLSITDILTNAKTFAVMAVTFTLCLLITIMGVDTANTLRSDSMVSGMSFCPSDAFMCSNEQQSIMNENGHDEIRDMLSDVDRKLDQNGMSGDVHCEVGYNLSYKKDDTSFSFSTLQGVGTKADCYSYLRGTPPQSANEIAITHSVAEKLGVDIGDTVTLMEMDGEHEMLVTALFQTMMNMGDGVRLHEDFMLNYSQPRGALAIQIDFDEELSESQLKERREKLREIFPEYEVYSGEEYIDNMIGVASIVERITLVLLPILLIVCALVTVLMERSLIARDKGEIAMLKASGFSDGFIVRWHMLRTAMVMLVSAVVAILLSTPFAQITSAFAFKIMGAQSIEFDIHPVEVYVIYPLTFLTAALIAVFFTALSTKKITANQTAGIE